MADFLPDAETIIGPSVYIAPFCVVYQGADLRSHVILEPFALVGPGTIIQERTRVIYGARIHNNVRIGTDCIIGGNCPDRTRLGNGVTHMGRLCHGYNTPHLSWDATEEPSAVLHDNAVIGANSTIVGAVSIGERAYIAAGEVVRTNVPARTVVYGGRHIPAARWRGRLRKGGFFDA